MFSANENLMLRQHKRRIVDFVEATMPEDALDMGTVVMVMQVSCKAPGCVPLETAIIIVFPNSPSGKEELLVPGLPESGSGGSYKTKVLKPMAEVTQDDILEALPPAFEGGKRSMENLCIAARDVMLSQITQLFGEEQDHTVADRTAMAEYLQQCLQDYVARDCKPPELGEPFAPLLEEEKVAADKEDDSKPTKESTTTTSTSSSTSSSTVSVSSSTPNGNFVIRRDTAPAKSKPPAIMGGPGRKQHHRAIQQALNPYTTNNNIAALFQREHAPGIRQAGCPCCDPENPSNIVDSMMML
jgi:hypothetical protein